MENMSIKYRIPLAILAILLVIVLFIGSSYALWKLTVYQQTVNKIETGCFEIAFSDDNSTSINLKNAYPISDEAGLKTTPYTFTVTNTCSVSADYKIYLNTLKIDSGQIPDEYIKYAILKTGDSVTTANLVSTLKTNTEISSFSYTGKTLDTSYTLATGILKEGESAQYSLRLWIDSSATTEINGQKFEAAITSVAYATQAS